MIDPETNKEHVPPDGLRHQGPRTSNGNIFYSDIKMRHYIIRLHQEAFPELADQMRRNPNNAVNIYSAFLAIVPLQIKGKLTEEQRGEILKLFKVIK